MAPLGVAVGARPDLLGLQQPARTAAVERLVASGPAGARLDRLVALAARQARTSHAQVSLLTARQQVLAAAHGAPLDGSGRSSPLEDSLCSVTAASGRPLAVDDTSQHPWVRDLPPATSGQVGAYLGVPLVSAEGLVLGALCVHDQAPRAWTEADVRQLTELGVVVAEELDEHAAVSTDLGVRARVAADAAELGTFVFHLGEQRLDWDERMAGLHGYSLATFDGSYQAWARTVHPDDVPPVVQALEQARTLLGEIVCEYRVVRPGADTRWVRLRGRVLPDMLGAPAFVVGAAYDASTERNLRDELGRLMETMPSALVRFGRDWRFTYVNADAERIYGRTREQLVGATMYEAFPEVAGTAFDTTYRRVMDGGDPEKLEAYFPPLDATFEVHVWPDEQGLTLFFHDVSDRVRSQDALEHASERLALLASGGARLSRTLQPAQVLGVLADVVVPQLAGSIVTAVTPAVAEALGLAPMADPEQLYIATVRHRSWGPEAAPDLSRRLTPARRTADAGLRLAARTGRVHALESVPEQLPADRGAADGAAVRQERPCSGPRLSVPLVAPAGVLGAFTVVSDDDAPLDELLLLDLASRAAVSLDNAMTYARQHRAATVLQAALLPATPTRVGDVQLATRYVPAVAEALAGGDFFKTVQVGRRLVCALGDVMGHGTPSAARAGQLHGLVAALALQGLTPGALLGQLAAGVDQMLSLELATLLVCSYDPDTRTLVAATAGHPPPLLVPSAGRQADYLDVVPGAPLGVTADTYPETTVVLPAGTAVVLFSDGLVERRGESLTDGLERLRCAVDGGLTPDGLADRLCDRLLSAGGSDDDVALLVLTHP
ncbi:MAG: putative sensor protein [Frankiales bacterium]|nr:putative sensor protein [Frankiales bacterium]